MQLVYSFFYKQFGIRKAQQLLMPRVFPMEQFHFPRNIVYHFVSHDPEVIGPDEKLSYFNEIPRRIPTEHITQLKVQKGAARKASILPMVLFRPFHNRNKHFRWTKDAVDATKDPLTPIIFNYGLLQRLYKYTVLPMTEYNRWWNIEKTAWDEIQKLTVESSRQQFVFIEIPEILPSFNTLRMFSTKQNPALLRVFDTPEKLFILELYKWLDPELRPETIFSGLGKDQLDKVNLVLKFKNYWSVLNLGFLELSRKGTEVGPEFAGSQFEPIQLQKFMLRMMMRVQTNGLVPEESDAQTADPVTQVEAPPEIEPKEDQEVLDPDESQEEIDQEPEDNYSLGILKGKKPEITSKPAEIKPKLLETSELPDENMEEPDNTAGFDFTQLLEEIDKDLESLEYIEKKNLKDKGFLQNGEEAKKVDPVQTYVVNDFQHQAISEEVYQEVPPEDQLKKLIDEQAEYGLMPASEYRKLLAQAEAFGQSANPYTGKESVKEFVTIPPEKLAIKKEETQLAVSENVTDPSMKEASLNTFVGKYVKDIMPKDVVGMVSHIQKAGMIVQNYEIEQVESVLGDYEIHTVKVKPIDGALSTIRFKLPKVDENGDLEANGKKYKMRCQRAELPLRKTNPFTVALSSYYGRTFVRRSEKKAYDSMDWLAKHILIAGNDSANTIVSEVKPADVFDNLFKSPTIYSGLSKYFKSFKLNGDYFSFDQKDRSHILNPELLTSLEQNGKLLVGVAKDQSPIFIDSLNEFYKYSEGQYQPMGTIYQLLMLDQTRAPLDFVELAVFSKSIPVGLVLGYMIGLTKLIQLLKVVPRVYEARQRIDLAQDEWVMAFKDKSLVFSRKTPLASLILAGFNEYKREIKQYFLESFDHPNVYMNVLEPSGVGARFLREIDLMDQLFVDPITRDILIEMKEPTTFKGLLVRASELVTEDYHPDAQDMYQMRIKGYERFAGAAYKEMSHAIRAYKARNIRGKSQVEISPYAVWQNILQDPSVKPPAEINPIQNLKEAEAVTFVGEGGRSKDTMSKATREYHVNDMGIISEASVDSSDVGVNTYLSANPRFSSVRGLVQKGYDPEKDGVTSLMSTAALASVGSDSDDMKRVNFCSLDLKESKQTLLIAGTSC